MKFRTANISLTVVVFYNIWTQHLADYHATDSFVIDYVSENVQLVIDYVNENIGHEISAHEVTQHWE